MLKRMALSVFTLIILLSFIGCKTTKDIGGVSSVESETEGVTNSNVSDNSDNDADKVILKDVAVYSDYAVLSLCDVLTDMGFELIWSDTDNATFTCNGIEYSLCISQKTLSKNGVNDNYLICAPGNNNFVCDVVDGVLMVDDNTVKCLFNTFIKYPVYVSIDPENQSVIITKR